MIKVKKEITQARLKELLRYDSHLGVFIWIAKSSIKAHKIRIGDVAGNQDCYGYRVIGIDGCYYKEHRLVWLYMNGGLPCGERALIDHIDGNRSNNKYDNLRVCDSYENMRNRSKQVNNTTGFVGVGINRALGKYVATIRNPQTKKREHLGYFETLEEAVITRETKAVSYYGEFYRDVK